MVEFKILTEKGNVPPSQTAEIGALVLDLVAYAQPKASNEIALNALLGAYLTLARNSEGISFEKSLRGMISAGQQILNSEAQPSKPGSPGAIVRATEDLSDRIANLLVNERHEVALGALLGLFRSVAMRYSCCTTGAAFAAADVAGQLSAHAAKAAPTGPLH